MSDVFSSEKRHEVMSLIKSKNSKAELIVFRYLRNQGVYHQKHYKRVIGTPDIALPRKKKAVFVDGDFWHGRGIEKLMTKRGVDDFWTLKILRNIERDKITHEALLDLGWEILNVWESDLNRKRTRETTLTTIKEFLTT